MIVNLFESVENRHSTKVAGRFALGVLHSFVGLAIGLVAVFLVSLEVESLTLNVFSNPLMGVVGLLLFVSGVPLVQFVFDWVLSPVFEYIVVFLSASFWSLVSLAWFAFSSPVSPFFGIIVAIVLGLGGLLVCVWAIEFLYAEFESVQDGKSVSAVVESGSVGGFESVSAGGFDD